MKHLLTLLQVFYWLIIDFILLLFHFKWNMYLRGYYFKKRNGIVTIANNAEKKQMKTVKGKYSAAFLLNT